MNLKNKILIFSLSFLFSFSLFSAASAQTAYQVLISWQAQNFVPADYQGKILPSPGSDVILGLELVIQNKIKDISKADILWYLDENLLSRGQGLKETSFTASKGAGDTHIVRVAINYQQQEYDGTISIPVAGPKISILIPSPANNAVSLGKNIFQAVPYFFNISGIKDLFFSWSVNGQATSGNSSNLLELTLTPPLTPSRGLNMKVSAQNLKNNLELANKEINLNVQQ